MKREIPELYAEIFIWDVTYFPKKVTRKKTVKKPSRKIVRKGVIFSETSDLVGDLLKAFETEIMGK